MRKSKIIALGLVLTLSLTAFTGCGCQNSSDTTSKNETKAETKNETKAEEYYVSGDGYKVNIEADLSQGDWYYDGSYADNRLSTFYNVASKDDVVSNTPNIEFRIETTEIYNERKDNNWENVTELGTKNFGEYEATGYQYRNVGMDWTTYVINLDENVVLLVASCKLDLSDGTDAANVWNSLKFTVEKVEE